MENFEIRDGVLVKYRGEEERVEVPQGVLHIGERAFEKAEGLRRVVLPEGLESIGALAFREKTVLEDIAFPESLQSIGPRAFLGCRSLQNVVLPEGLQYFPENAFGDCRSLKSIRFPESRTEISSAWFTNRIGCQVLAPGVPMAAVASNPGKLAALKHFCRGQEQGIVYRDPAGFRDYAGKVHDSGELGDLALKEPSVLRYLLREKLLQLPDVDALLEKVRASLEDWEKLQASPRWEQMQQLYGRDALRAGEAEDREKEQRLLDYLHAVFTQADRDAWEEQEKEQAAAGYLPEEEARSLWAYETSERGGVRLTGYQGCEAELAIPRGIGRRTVTEIQVDGQAPGWKLVRRLFLPKEVRQIGGFLYACPGLQEITVEEGHPRFCLQDGCLIDFTEAALLSGPPRLWGSFTVPAGIRHIGADAFRECTDLREIVLPEGLVSIGKRAFNHCEKLEHLVLPEGVESIDDGAFQFCSSLQSAVLPESLQHLGSEAFAACRCLQRIHLPSQIRRIEAHSFTWCESLESVDLPKGLQSIETGAFGVCSGLKHLELPEGLQKIGSGAFAGCGSLQSLVLPQSLQICYGQIFTEQCAPNNKAAVRHSAVIAPWVRLSDIRPTEERKQALLNFLWAREQGYVYQDAEKYLRFARKHTGWLSLLVQKDLELLRQVTSVQILTKENVEALLPGAETEARLLLLNYKNTYFPEEDAGEDILRLEDLPAEDVEGEGPDGWMKGKIFVHSGLDRINAEKFERLVRECGGIVKSSTVRETDYLVYDTKRRIGKEKFQRAKELQMEGRKITFLTLTQWEERVQTALSDH